MSSPTETSQISQTTVPVQTIETIDYSNYLFEAYENIIKKSVWNLIIGNSYTGKDFCGNKYGNKKKTVSFHVFMNKYNGSFDKMVNIVSIQSYPKIIEEINNFNKENSCEECDEEQYEDINYELFSSLTSITTNSLGGLSHLHNDCTDNITDELKELFSDIVWRPEN